jgi:hypothetical protein
MPEPLLSTLKQRDFALLWFSGLLSMMGGWAMFASQPFYAYELRFRLVLALFLLPNSPAAK